MFINANVSSLLRSLGAPTAPGSQTPQAGSVSEAERLAQKTAMLTEIFGSRLAAVDESEKAAPRPQYNRDGPPIDGQQSFMFPGVIATPATNGLDTSVFSYRVPDGYVGVIDAISCNYTGGGGAFVPGSGNLTFRILIDKRAVKNYEAIQVELGSTQQRLHIAGIELEPNRVFEWVVNHATTSPLPVGGTFIVCFFGGAFWPALETL